MMTRVAKAALVLGEGLAEVTDVGDGRGRPVEVLSKKAVPLLAFPITAS
jgi:hypothetical protein